MEKTDSRLELFAHNIQAYEAAERLMEETGKAAVIHPTGTGKSFIAFKLAEQHSKQKILWLAPSEYIFKTQVENLRKVLAVPEAEKDAALQEIIGNVEFITYAKLMMQNGKLKGEEPDYIILDEFHRCGAREWGSNVQKLIGTYPNAKLLGLSATNIRYLDNQRDMAEELFNGCIASEMSLGEAIAKQILPAPTYVISMYAYQEECARLAKRIESERNQALKKENEKLIEELRRALEKAEGLDYVFAKHIKANRGKYLVFCADKKHMKEMVKQAKEWFHLVDREPHIYAVYYDNPESSKAFANFKEDESEHLRLLFCIDMLNEGVHVDKIDGVILLRPTVSPILYLQQIGRALSTGKTAPVIFDIVNNFDGLYSVDALQEEFEHTLNLFPGVQEEKQRFRESFRIIDEVRDCRKLFSQINCNLSASWETYYSAAKQFYEKTGHLIISKDYVTEAGLSLGSWLSTQRRVYAGLAAGHLSQEQIEKLEHIGMDWENINEQKFKRGAEELGSYVKQFDNADVPANYVTESGYALGKWVSNTRTAYKNGKLKSAKIEQLSELGMIWDVHDYRWRVNYKEAKRYYDTYGNLSIPINYVTQNGVALGRWVANQIRNHNQEKTNAAKLTTVQERMLEAIGIVWKNKFEDGWDRRYELAKAYYEKHGNLDLPSNYTVDGINVDKWVRNIRLKKSNPNSSNLILSEERIDQMNCIGMRWNRKIHAEAAKHK